MQTNFQTNWLVFLAFAALTPVAKLVWSNGHVITNSSGYGVIVYNRRDVELAITYSDHKIVKSSKIRLSDVNLILSQSSFVAEWVTGPGLRPADKTESFCQSASSSELRPLIIVCNGLVRLRELNAEEKSEMDAFKSDVQGWFDLRFMTLDETNLLNSNFLFQKPTKITTSCTTKVAWSQKQHK